MSRRKAFIFGIYGQDGYYLSKLLLGHDYEIVGTFHKSNYHKQSKFEEIGIETNICDIRDKDRVSQLLSKFNPHEVYNLAGISSVVDSWYDPTPYIETNSIGVLNILNALTDKSLNLGSARFFQASSSEMFGDTGLIPANEDRYMAPRSPYAVSKLVSHQFIGMYREKYNCFLTSGILFNHESPLRNQNFLSKKITTGVVKVLKGESEKIMLGNLEIRRDWSFAGDIVQAAWSMLQQPVPMDYVLASGESKTVQNFVEVAFDYVGIKNWRRHVQVNEKLIRSNEAKIVEGNPAKARINLNWKPRYSFEDMIKVLIDDELKNQVK